MSEIEKVSPKKKGWVLGAAGVIVVIGIFGGATLVRALASPVSDARSGYDFLAAGIRSLRRAEFTDATGFFDQSSALFFSAQKKVEDRSFAKRMPIIGRELQSASQLFSVGGILAQTASEAAGLAAQAVAPFRREQAADISSLTPEMRRVFLETVYQSPPVLRGLRAEVGLAEHTIDSLPRGVITFFLRREMSDLQGALALAGTTLDDAIPLIELFPKLAGYPSERTYLFLLQNNTELRPSGGFIGTYGIVKVENGHLTQFFTDDSYNLDRFVDAKKRPPTPAPLLKYLGQKQWYFRDANWSPDFEVSAQTALRFYKEEGGTENPHGVIAVTPDVVIPFVRAMGPITVEGQTFTAENFVDLLEYQVEVAFAESGIPRPQRKAIISVLAHELLGRFYRIPLERIPSLVSDLRRALDEKHFLVYSDDADLQGFVESMGWAGRVLPSEGDALLVVDANLASLKSDPVVDRTVEYTVAPEAGEFVGRVKITYTNKGEFSWKTTRYRTYTRVYVPLGSVLREVRGAMVKEKDATPGMVDVTQELGKTVFGAFISIEPGESRALEFTYTLPQSVRQDIEQKKYQLLIQKQAGVPDRDLTVRLDFGTKVRVWSPTGLSAKRVQNGVEWRTPLRRDQIFEVGL
ncbi:MAG: DUF4012 domain-containing protein [Patescibacteria group bacterium]